MPIREFFSDWCERRSTRRNFLTRTGLAAASLATVCGSRAKAQAVQVNGNCPVPVDITASTSMISLPDSQVFFWIHLSPNLGVSTLALYLAVQQNASHYVDRVVLTDEQLNTLATRYFTASMQNSQGYLPYLIFDQIVLPQNGLFLYLRLIEGQQSSIYRYTLTPTQLQRSHFSGNALPSSLVKLFVVPFANGISSPLNNALALFKSSSCLAKNLEFNACFGEHRATASFTQFGPAHSFKLLVTFEHPEEVDHYMRFFFLCDPVGRLLGMKERSLNEAPLNQTVISEISTQDALQWGIASELIAHIADCPYVILFWEENKHAFREQILWLR